MPGQGRLGDRATGTADAHGCPACPHSVMGPGVSGSPDVNVNGRPALRVSDQGKHAACCAGNSWEANTGSATVFINGKAAHRIGDLTVHCGGTGKLAEGSADVIVGDGGSAGAGGPSVGSVDAPPAATPGQPVVISVGAIKLPRPFVTVAAPVTWTIDGQEHPERGQTLTVTLGREHAGKRVVIAARLGASPPVETVLAVPKLTIEGPDTVEIGDEIQLRAKVDPPVAGDYRWFDADGKSLGDGPGLAFAGKKKSERDGDQPAECRFTVGADGSVLTERHPITVEQVPRLKVPISLSLQRKLPPAKPTTMDETAAWLRDNPIEVRVDGEVTPSHAMAEKPGLVTVSFRLRAG